MTYSFFEEQTIYFVFFACYLPLLLLIFDDAFLFKIFKILFLNLTYGIDSKSILYDKLNNPSSSSKEYLLISKL